MVTHPRQATDGDCSTSAVQPSTCPSRIEPRSRNADTEKGRVDGTTASRDNEKGMGTLGTLLRTSASGGSVGWRRRGRSVALFLALTLWISMSSAALGQAPAAAQEAQLDANASSESATGPGRSLSDFTLVGSASSMEDRIRLTPSDSWNVGAAWVSARQPVSGPFSEAFSFRMDGGADGFAFVIQNHSATAVGGVGGGIGYGCHCETDDQGIPNSLAVEFDITSNAGFEDPDSNHISIHTRGTAPNSPREEFSLGRTSDIPKLADGYIHHVGVNYAPGTLEVFLDGAQAPTLSVPVDLQETLDLGDDGKAWLGFTAATGSDMSNHDIFVSNAPPTDYRSHIVADNPISYWPLDETSGTLASDVQGRNPGSVEGGVTPGASEGVSGKAMRFDGAPDSGIGLDSNPDSLAPNEALTVEAWVKSDGDDKGVVFRWRWHGYALVLNGDQTISFDGYDGTQSWYGTTTTTPITPDEWHHIVGTKDANSVNVYVDGTLSATASTNPGIYYQRGGGVAIGRDGDAGDGVVPSFEGLLDEVAVYAHALPADRIQAHYTAAGYHPKSPDGDGDGVEDSVDNCPETANSDQADSDGDGVGDACESAETPACPDRLEGEPRYWCSVRPKSMSVAFPRLRNFKDLGTITIGGFIPEKETPIFPVSLAGRAGPRIFRGDNRGFSSDGTINPNRNRFYIELDFASRRGFIQVNPTCRVPGSGHHGTCQAPYDLLLENPYEFGDADMVRQGKRYRHNFVSFGLSDDKRSFTATWSVAQSAEGWGMDLLRPRADGEIRIDFKRDKWHFSFRGDCFPSLEVVRSLDGRHQIVGQMKHRKAISMFNTFSNIRHAFGEYC